MYVSNQSGKSKLRLFCSKRKILIIFQVEWKSICGYFGGFYDSYNSLRWANWNWFEKLEQYLPNQVTQRNKKTFSVFKTYCLTLNQSQNIFKMLKFSPSWLGCFEIM